MTKKLGFGFMRLPVLEDGKTVDTEATARMVDAFMARGFTYFDTAWMYCHGKSEEILGKVLVDRYPRDSFTITTKLPAYMLNTEDDREKVFSEQLRRTGAGYFDYYWLHDVNTGSVKTFDALNCWDFIREKKAAGLVRHIGFSYHDGPELLDELLTKHPEIEYVQLQINYLDWDSLGIQSEKCLRVAEKHRKPVIVMEPVKGGTLASVPEDFEKLLREREPDMSASSWAIRFAASAPNVFMVLSGMSNMEQLLDNTGYMADFKPLTEEEFALVLSGADIIRRNIAIQCTGCSYCTVNCPRSIPIPAFFSLYNTELQELPTKEWTPQKGYYDNLTINHSSASDCIGCGQCEKMCPQHLSIRKYLTCVAKKFSH